jgi:hypothetical protein
MSTKKIIVKKITTGFVIQTYDTVAGRYTAQEFVAGDEVVWEDEGGEPVEASNAYLNFDMVQPEYQE